MTTAAGQPHLVLSAGLPLAGAVAVFAVTLTAWIGLRAVSRRAGRSAGARAGMFALRAGACFACLLAAMRLSSRLVLLTTDWPLWAIALGGGLAVEMLLSLYAPERTRVGPGAGAAMAGLRVSLVLLVVAMLTQPVFSWQLVETLDRHVAVLVDTSASMSATDAPPTPASDVGLADRSRLGRAVALLRGPDDANAAPGASVPGGLLAKLRGRYKVDLYEFAERCVPTDAASLAASTEAAALMAGPASMDAPSDDDASGLPAGRHVTDLGGALARVAADTADKRLAGIVVLTDGRHNAPDRPEPMAAKLGLARTPVCPVVMASTRPPRDAAVLSLDAPQRVMTGDKLLVRAELKIDGLAGQDVQVSLMDGPREADSVTLHVPDRAATWRPRAMLTDTPTGVSLRTYRVRISPREGEAFVDNNSKPLTVEVTDQPMRLLLIDSHPRWEYRFLRNMFDGRDPGVRLQCVLLHPDEIAGAPRRAVVAASAVRPMGESEATALPATPDEWMKFDVIVLGDVGAKSFRPWQLDTLRRFVTDRGGTLVTVAGPNHMPRGLAGTPLVDILPIRPIGRREPAPAGPAEGFHIALTDDGRDNPVMFQAVDPGRNDDIWSAMPPIYWRATGLEAAPGATVLAYAAAADGPQPTATTARADSASNRRRRQAELRAYERANPLIAIQQVAAGRVMAICFDSTWRMRYRAGDARHHLFWGQVMRWATAQRLCGGTDHVQLGAGRCRYEADQEVLVRARIVRPDLSPVLSQDVWVRLYRGQNLLMRRKMAYQPSSAGTYEAALGVLDAGAYRIELEAPDAASILAADGATDVSAQFAVDAVGSEEELELSANSALLDRLANLSGGEVIDPNQAGRLIELLGPSSVTTRQNRELRVWDSWPLLAMIIVAASAEWFLRKRNGLC